MELGEDFLTAFEIFCKFHLLFHVNVLPELSDFFNCILSIAKLADPTFRSAQLLKMLNK